MVAAPSGRLFSGKSPPPPLSHHAALAERNVSMSAGATRSHKILYKASTAAVAGLDGITPRPRPEAETKPRKLEASWNQAGELNPAGTKLGRSRFAVDASEPNVFGDTPPRGGKMEPRRNHANMLRFVTLALRSQAEPSWNQARTKQAWYAFEHPALGNQVEPSRNHGNMWRFVAPAMRHQAEPSWDQAGTKQETS